MVKKKEDKEEVVNEISAIYEEIEKMGGRVSKKLDDLKPPYFLGTGLFSLDRIFSDEGGIPGNICVEIFGPNSTGKTSLALQIAAQAQKRGMQIFYINAERAINASIVKCFSELNPSKVGWVEPDNGEKAIDIMTHILQTQKECLIINDSIPACLPSQIDEALAGEVQVGALARLFSPFMPKAKKFCSLNHNILIQLNQERAKIGPMTRGGTDQPGGNAIKFYSDIRIKIEKRYPNPEIKIGEDIMGHYIIAKAIKSRCGIPYRTAELPIIYGRGFDFGRELADYATSFNVVIKKGAWYNLFKEGTNPDKDQPIFKAQGMDQMASYIRENPEVRIDIERRLREILS